MRRSVGLSGLMIIFPMITLAHFRPQLPPLPPSADSCAEAQELECRSADEDEEADILDAVVWEIETDNGGVCDSIIGTAIGLVEDGKVGVHRMVYQGMHPEGFHIPHDQDWSRDIFVSCAFLDEACYTGEYPPPPPIPEPNASLGTTLVHEIAGHHGLPGGRPPMGHGPELNDLMRSCS